MSDRVSNSNRSLYMRSSPRAWKLNYIKKRVIARDHGENLWKNKHIIQNHVNNIKKKLQFLTINFMRFSLIWKSVKWKIIIKLYKKRVIARDHRKNLWNNKHIIQNHFNNIQSYWPSSIWWGFPSSWKNVKWKIIIKLYKKRVIARDHSKNLWKNKHIIQNRVNNIHTIINLMRFSLILEKCSWVVTSNSTNDRTSTNWEHMSAWRSCKMKQWYYNY